MTESYNVNAIGHVNSPYKEKFAIPRQPGLVSAAQGDIALSGEFNHADMVKSLETFSHIWVIFVFHETMEQGWKPLVRPPRLGGNQKVGVLATRSTFRPNPIGMSVVKLDDIQQDRSGSTKLIISGLDLLDGTPVLDIKPYIPYADSINNAHGGYANEQPNKSVLVTFSQNAQKICDQAPKHQQLHTLITQILSQDPRPAYKQHKPDSKTYGIRLFNYNITWQFNEASIHVIAIEKELK